MSQRACRPRFPPRRRTPSSPCAKRSCIPEEGFDSVDSVPVEGRMMRLEGRGARCVRAENFADGAFPFARFLIRLHVAQRGRAEDRRLRFFRKTVDFQNFPQGAADRFVDEDRLLRRKNGTRLLEVKAPVDALKKDSVDVRHEFFNRRIHRKTRVFAEFRVFRHAIPAVRIVRRSAGIDPGDLEALIELVSLRIVDRLNKRRNVRRRRSDHANLEDFAFRAAARRRRREKKRRR